MCATVCPSQALTFATPETIARERREVPTNTFQFGRETVKTKVFMMTPVGVDEVSIDVADYMWEARA
jgi:ferredoxin